MQLDEIIANPNLYPPKERKEQKSTYYSIKKELNKLDQLLQGNQIENKVIEVEPQKEIQQQKLIEKKMPFKDVISLLYDFKIGDKKIDKYTNQQQIQEIKEIPYVLNNIEKQERQQFQLQTQLDQTEMLKAFEKRIHTLEIFKEVQISNKQIQFYEQNKGLLITSITCFENMVAFGTARATLYIQFNNQIIQLEQSKKINLSPIICLRFFDKGTKLIGISEKQVLLYIKNQFVKAFELKIEGIPVAMTVCQKQKNFKIQLLMTNTLGDVYGIRIKQTLLAYEMQMKLALKENNICHQIESINFQDQEYILLTFKDEIQIINLKPEYQLLIKLNYKVKENRFIQAKWQIEKKALQLAISNENTFEVLSIQFEKQKDRLKSNLNLLCQYSFQNEDIKYLIWLSNDIIFIKHERKMYSLIAISEILEQKIQIIQKQLNHDIQSYKMGEVLSFENSICNYQNFLFYISAEEQQQKQRIVQYKLNTWEDQMQQYQLNDEWKEQFGMGLYLYQGKLIKLGNLPRIGRQEYLKPHLHIQIQRFVENSIKSQSFNSIYIAMDFLILIESYEFLFNQIYLIYKNHKFERQFYESLESFINKGVIKQISTDLLKDLLEYLIKYDKLKLLKLFLFNLDKRFLNYTLIKEFCIKHNLQSILLYIPPKEIEDYKAPLLTIFEIYQLSLNNNNNYDLQYYFKSIYMDINSLSKKQIDEEIQRLGYKCIWFMSILLKGESFSQEKIPDNYQSQILCDILQWLLKGEILERFLQIDAGIFLNELLIILKDNKIYSKLQKFEIEQKGNQQEELTVCEILIRKIEVEIKKLNMINQFHSFIWEIMKLGYQISYEDFLQVIIHNLRYPYENLQIFIDKSNYKYQKMEYKIQKDMKDQEKIKRDNLLIQYITFFTNKLLVDDQSMQTILSEASCSILSCSRIQSEIYFLKGDWIKCISTMLASTSVTDKEFIFNYIDRILNSNQFENLRKEIIQYCLTFVQSLADISVERLKILLQYFPNDLYKLAIDKLDNHPNFKLYLLNQIIQEQRNMNQIIDNQIMISYIRLLCKHHPEEVIEELQYGDFPQEDCIIICKEYKIMKGVAFLKERSGCLQEALDIYFDEICIDFNMLELGYSYIQLIEKLQILILPCLKICRENYSNQDDNFQFWFTSVQRMVTLRQQFIHQENKFNSINIALQEILVEMLDRVHPKLIINNISQLFKCFTRIDELRRTTLSLEKLCFFQLITYEQFIENQKIRNFEKLEKLYDQDLKGTNLIEKCLICQSENEKYMYGFMSCCHIFHKQCLRMIKNIKVCQICLERGIKSYQLKVQLEILVDNNNEQFCDQQLKQPTPEEQLQVSKQEKRILRIDKWKMLDIENEIKAVLY